MVFVEKLYKWKPYTFIVCVSFFLPKSWMWTLGTFLICLVSASIVAFLLAPRSVSIVNQVTDLKPYNISYITSQNGTIMGMVLYFDETYLIDNNNFYEIRITNLVLQLNRNSHVVLPQINFEHNAVVSGRTKRNFVVNVRYIFYTLNDPYASLCIRGVIDELFTLISASFTFSNIWTKSQQYDTSDVQYLFCNNQTNSSSL